MKEGYIDTASSQFLEFAHRTNACLICSIERKWDAASFISHNVISPSTTFSRTLCWKPVSRLWRDWRWCCLNSGEALSCFRFSFWSFSFPCSYLSITSTATFQTLLEKTDSTKIFSFWVRDMSYNNWTLAIITISTYRHHPLVQVSSGASLNVLVVVELAVINTYTVVHTTDCTSGRMYFEQAFFQSRVGFGTSSAVGSLPPITYSRDWRASTWSIVTHVIL